MSNLAQLASMVRGIVEVLDFLSLHPKLKIKRSDYENQYRN
jgi:hypothetical protein